MKGSRESFLERQGFLSNLSNNNNNNNNNNNMELIERFRKLKALYNSKTNIQCANTHNY